VVVGGSLVVVAGAPVVVVGAVVVVVAGWQVRPPTHSPSQQAPLQQISPTAQKSCEVPLLMTTEQLPSPLQSRQSAQPVPNESGVYRQLPASQNPVGW
jgi:hypothetical protein